MTVIVYERTTGAPQANAGQLLRAWRAHRRLSQLELSAEARISQRHLSFIESGRARASREMLLHIAEQLQVPLRERNSLLLAAGYAPVYRARPLTAPDLAGVREIVDRVLKAHEPNPAILVDRYWNLVAANAALAPLTQLATDTSLVAPPVNVLRLTLHPAGLASAIVNLAAVRGHILDRLRRLIEATADPQLDKLLVELEGYPATNAHSDVAQADTGAIADAGSIVLPLRLKFGDAVLSFISTITVFGTPLDITLSELALETLFPEDAATAAALRALAGAAKAS
jgi:transcriptional regulator with XRE-family HTH domain